MRDDGSDERWTDRRQVTPGTLLTLARCALADDLPVTALPGAWCDGPRLTDLAAAAGTSLAAPLLHVTVDRQRAGRTRRHQVRWAPSAAVASGPEPEDPVADRDAPVEVRIGDAARFPTLVVDAIGLPAGTGTDEVPVAVPASRLAAAVAGGPDAPSIAGVPADQVTLVTVTVVAPAGDGKLHVLTPPGPQPGTEPVSRALLIAGERCWRIGAVDAADATADLDVRLRLEPWSADAERRWCTEVVTGVADRLGR